MKEGRQMKQCTLKTYVTRWRRGGRWSSVYLKPMLPDEGGAAARTQWDLRGAADEAVFIWNLCYQMKEGRRLGGVHAGPESRVLEGVSWEEARQMQDAAPSSLGKKKQKLLWWSASEPLFLLLYTLNSVAEPEL